MFGLKGRLLLGNGETIAETLSGEVFDLVYSFGVIHHTPDPRRVVGQVRRLLTPEGEFRLMVYARNSWKNIMIEAGLDQPEAQNGCPIALTFTPDAAAELLGGFQILEMRQDHIFPFVVEKYRAYKYERQPWFAAMPDKMFRALEQGLGWHLLIRATPTGLCR